MTTRTFQAYEIPLSKVFSNEYHFEMPLYQRPYTWEASNTEELLSDLLDAAMGSDPYFLGSIVLIKQDRQSVFEVVDGQQRLTTLTMLFCVLRELADCTQRKNNLDSFIYEIANSYAGTEDRFRLQIRERDREFFQDNVQKPGRLEDFIAGNNQPPGSSRELICQSAKYLWDELQDKQPAERDILATFLIQNCYMVVVTASNQDAAHRIFSVLNARGMDLSATDILKSHVIGEVPVKSQEAYTAQWEEIEEALGRDGFDRLFGHLYTIFMRRKPAKSLEQSFEPDVLSQTNGIKFIDDVLVPYSDAYRMILETSFHGTEYEEKINKCLQSLNRLSGKISFWIAPAMEFIHQFSDDGERLLRLLQDLERLTYGMLFLPVSRDSRRTRYDLILRALEFGIDQVFEDTNSLQLSDGERREIAQKIDGPLTFLTSDLKRALLLKLDEVLVDAGARYDHKMITIEHVLPQNPSEASEWFKLFSEDERDYWTDRLANLVLLSRSKNARAQNYGFEQKRNEYFNRKGVTPFALTTQVLNETEWTPEILEKRQNILTQLLSNEWRLA